jgi:glycosyltransferase 2 family protein
LYNIVHYRVISDKTGYMNASFKLKRFWFALLLGLLVLFYALGQADFKVLARSLENIDFVWTVMAIVASGLSYLCIAAVLYFLLKGAGHLLSFFVSARITIVSSTLNYVMATGGLSGMAIKVYLLTRKGIQPSSTLSISMVHGFLTNTVAVVFIYLGFFYLYSQHKMTVREMGAGIAILLFALLLTWFTIRSILHESFRRKMWKFCRRLASAAGAKLPRPRWFHPEKADQFFENFNTSMNYLVRNSRILLKPAIFALLDWLLMISCLKCAFLAVHYPIGNRALLVGFSAGIFVTLVSLTPASVGITEGAMTGSFYLMGLDYDQALLATVIYRVAYFYLPMFLGLLVYNSLLADTDGHLEDPRAEERQIDQRPGPDDSASSDRQDKQERHR